MIRSITLWCLSGLLTFASSVSVLAQQPPYAGGSPASVVGMVLEKQSGTPVEFAAVSILAESDSSLRSGTITDEKGMFRIEGLSNGGYFLKVEFLGYDPYFTNFVLSSDAPFYKAGKIELSVSSTVLEGVEISAERSYFQQSIDKKVYNIDKDIVASSGTASEALQNIPSITVDIDGNVSLRGNSNVRIFIDGKPSGLMGSSMVAILEQIPASSIESIEVVTNPSARYEAEGGGGIINIVLKKNKKVGLNGVATVGGSTFPGYDGSLTLNYRDKKWNLFGSYSYDNRTRDGWSEVSRKVFYEDNDSTSYYNSDGESTDNRSGHNIRGGADYYINDRNTIGFSALYSTGNNNNDDLNNYFFYDNDSLLSQYNQRQGDGSSDNHNYNIGLNYRKTWENPKHLWTTDAFFSNGFGDGYTGYTEFTYDNSGAEDLAARINQQVLSDERNQDININSDYIHPFKNGNQLEAGARFTREFRDNDILSESFDGESGVFANDDSISNRFRFDQQVLAAYTIWNSSIGKLGYQLGLRAEQTFLTSELVTTGQSFNKDYFRLFPSVHLKYEIKKGVETNASYSRRINRPRSFFLNPFPEFSDPYTYRQGNPFLLPEDEHSFELGLTRIWDKHTLSSSVFYKHTDGEFSAYTTVDSNGLSRTTFENFSTEDSYGAEFVVRNEFFPWWSATSSLNVNRTILDASNIEAGLSNALTNYNARVMMFFKVLKQTSLQATYSYWRPWVMAQGQPRPFTFIDLGIRSDFFSNKLSVNLTVSDVFDTREFYVTNEGFNFSQEFRRKRESQAVSIRLSYKFGQQDNNRRRGGQGDWDNNGGGGMDMF
ncbi:MAG TPA: TonB-dependent receptor [Chitinophagales bacterium]|nr:TonB-dependent receptor [Chitinophagales bacterium]